MRSRVVFSGIIGVVSLLGGTHAYAAVLDSQTDGSAQSTLPINDGTYITSDGFYLAAGYVPSRDSAVAGLRLRAGHSDGASYQCPGPAIGMYEYYGTTSPERWDQGIVFASVVSATTTPDADGNCDYRITDRFGQSPVPVSANNYYIFLMNVAGNPYAWVSLSGKALASTTTQSLYGIRPRFHNEYKWGTSGLAQAYFQVFDTPPPFSMVLPDPCIAAHNCASNVLFLPGIEGSRLYEGTGCGKSAEEKLWEPYDGSITNTLRGAGDVRVRELSLDPSGQSVCSDIYTKTGDVIDSVGGSNLYKSFIDEMNGMKADGTIKDWEPAAYDWRFSFDDLLTRGSERDGKIYYEEATSTPYIEQTLRALAASSKTGKVTIVAHSNGGLLAKALLNKLGGVEATKLVDRVIMVAVPQTGAPADIGSLLLGYGAGIYQHAVAIVSNVAARLFAQNSPMAYHLLPSEDYLESTAGDTTHPVIGFSGTAYAKEQAAYGNTIANRSSLDDFLLAKEGGRTQASDSDLTSAKILNPALIDYANARHASLDFWTPPAGIKIDQIAGWGIDTVAGIDFYTPPPTDAASALNPIRAYRPIFTEDGDGTVPVPSAIMMASNADVARYWVDLHSYNKSASTNITHGDIFEIPTLEDFINGIITSTSSTLPTYISTTQPSSTANTKKLTFFLHSPLTLQLTDSSGRATGLAIDNSITQDIPGSTYGEFGEVKYVTVPGGNPYQLTMHGQAIGTFSLDTEETSNNIISASSTIVGVPTTASTVVSMDIPSDISIPSPMTIDENGDGVIDATIIPKPGSTVVFDTTPAEFRAAFSTSTASIVFVSTDDMSTTTVTKSTIYPSLTKKQKTGTATSTLIARDASGNTTILIYTEPFPLMKGNETVTFRALSYNGATTTLASTTASYKWSIRNGDYQTFTSSLKTTHDAFTSSFNAKKNATTILPANQILPGMVIPYMKTEKGNIIIGY